MDEGDVVFGVPACLPRASPWPPLRSAKGERFLASLGMTDGFWVLVDAEDFHCFVA